MTGMLNPCFWEDWFDDPFIYLEYEYNLIRSIISYYHSRNMIMFYNKKF